MLKAINKMLMKMLALMGLDIVCWVGAYLLAIHFGYPTVANWIGVIGILVISAEIVLYWRMIERANELKEKAPEIEAMVQRLHDALNERPQDEHDDHECCGGGCHDDEPGDCSAGNGVSEVTPPDWNKVAGIEPPKDQDPK